MTILSVSSATRKMSKSTIPRSALLLSSYSPPPTRDTSEELCPASQGSPLPAAPSGRAPCPGSPGADVPVRQSEPVLAEPLQQHRVLSTLLLHHPRLVLSRPHP